MTLASQGIFTPKNNITAFLNTSYEAFKRAVEWVHGQDESSHFINVASSVKRSIGLLDKLTTSQKYELLAMIRHEFYRAAESTREPSQSIHFLKQAVATQTVINQLRGRNV